METVWFCAISFMVIMYVILDGFDLGAGAIYLTSARTETERRLILNAIGPVWDGNEVWLVALGGTLFFAFPRVYASSFSGFYLPLMIVLWLLMLRGVGIEFRHRIASPLWKSFWDVVFWLGSFLLTFFFGAALGNVVRGVPLDGSGDFFEPLWTSFLVEPEAGILDWFTVVLGLVSVFTLVAHGANYIAMKTEGDLHDRSRSIATRTTWGSLITSAAALIGVSIVRPAAWQNYAAMPWGYLFPIAGTLGMAGMIYANFARKDGLAFASSATFIAGMLASTAFGLYPDLLPSITDPHLSLTAHNACADSYGLTVGVMWWSPAIVLALVYLAYALLLLRGKIKALSDEGY